MLKMDYNKTGNTVVVRPRNGMQLAEGFIRKDYDVCYIGQVPGLETRAGESKEDVRSQLEQVAKNYYGADVIVEIAYV